MEQNEGMRPQYSLTISRPYDCPWDPSTYKLDEPIDFCAEAHSYGLTCGQATGNEELCITVLNTEAPEVPDSDEETIFSSMFINKNNNTVNGDSK